MPSKVEIKSLKELEDMHTGSLMSRRKILLKCEESFELSDRVGHEDKPVPSVTRIIEFKDTAEWKQAYRELKSVLDKRENIPNKQERKSIRQENAKKRR